MSETEDILRGMRHRVRVGWCKRALEVSRPLLPNQYCVLGAYVRETGDHFTDAAEVPALRAILEVLEPMGYTSIPSFNDNRRTHKHDVIAVITAALQRVRGGDIGKPEKVIEFEPMPTDEPIAEPSPAAPAPAEPVREPVPA